eukprot:COSAG06_NODE_9255_length_1945_cov_6.531961_3_plen_54_part_00
MLVLPQLAHKGGEIVELALADVVQAVVFWVGQNLLDVFVELPLELCECRLEPH